MSLKPRELFRNIPGTKLTVYPINLGTADLGTAVERQTAFQILDAYTQQGGNFIDTAHIYASWVPGGTGASETLIGDWMAQRQNRAQLVLATKGGHPTLDAMSTPRLSRQEISHDLNESLQRLRTDCIDLYWLHRDDRQRPVDDILNTLNELVSAGKIRYFACSNWAVDRVQAANTYAVTHGLQGFAASQVLWNLAVMDYDAIGDKTLVLMDQAFRQYHAQTGLAAVPFTSQAQGLFQKLLNGTFAAWSEQKRAVYASPENLARAERVQLLAAQKSASITQVVLSFLMSQPFVTLPIIGPRSVAQMQDSLSAVGFTLTAAECAWLETGK